MKNTCHNLKFLQVVLILLFVACNNGKNNNAFSDTATTIADSMPVIKPQHTDSSGIITTPPVNDNNVIMPDTSSRSN